MPPKILVITGPTASGKTWLAAELAKRHNGEVVSADSMQIYRRMDIGTAKPTAEEMQGVPHHMIDVADPEEDFSAARYVDMAAACVDDVLSCGKLPVLAGGTGLYIDSLLSGRTFAAFDGASPLRSELEARYAREGGEALLRELAQAPHLITAPEPQRAASGLDAIRLQNELTQALNRGGESSRYMKSLILAAAAQRYSQIPDPTPAHRLGQLRARLEEGPADGETLSALLEAAVRAVRLSPGGTVKLELASGRSITEEKEESP